MMATRRNDFALSSFLAGTPIAAACLLATANVQAADLNSLQQLGQSEFKLLSEDLSSTLSYKPLIPSSALGVTGFDIGVALTATSIKNSDILSRASSNGSSRSTIPVPTLRADKGLPFGIDVGLMYAKIPSSNLKYVGGELRYAILDGDIALPSISVRGSFTQLQGVSQLGFRTYGLDVSISKRFVFVTPYGGVGAVWAKSDPKGVPLLSSESFTQSKVFGGVNFNLGLVNLAVEADQTGKATSYGAKVGFRF